MGRSRLSPILCLLSLASACAGAAESHPEASSIGDNEAIAGDSNGVAVEDGGSPGAGAISTSGAAGTEMSLGGTAGAPANVGDGGEGGTGEAGASGAVALTDAEVRQRLVADSIADYYGACPCPFSVDSAGHECGARSAYSRDGGASPLCYPEDVSDEMVQAYRDSHPWS
jgi:hypothetical protein